MIDRDRETAPHHDGAGPKRTEVQAKQGTGPRVMIWVLLLSLLLAIIIGGSLLTNTDELREGQSTEATSPGAATPPASEAR
jgi:hypothetical protein